MTKGRVAKDDVRKTEEAKIISNLICNGENLGFHPRCERKALRGLSKAVA